MNLIQDKVQFIKFISILPDLKNDEVYFLSLSARNKYLTKEEREYYSLGQTEMFGRTIARSKEQLIDYSIKKLEATLAYKTTRNHLPIPEKCLVAYMNINPSSMIKAYYQFQNEMNRQMSEIMQALQKGKQPNYSFINIQDRELMNCIQKSPSNKYFIDIDCDTKEEGTIKFLIDRLKDKQITFHTIETQGGFHFLLEKSSIPEKYNLNDLLIQAQTRLMDVKWSTEKAIEIAINSNAMVPIPGIMQAGFLVKFKEA